MKPWLWVVAGLAVVPIVIAWWTPAVQIVDDEQLESALSTVHSSLPVPLAELTPESEWDEVHVFGGYTDIDAVQDQIDARLTMWGLPFINTEGSLLVFMRDGEPVKASRLRGTELPYFGVEPMSIWSAKVEVVDSLPIEFQEPGGES